MNVLPSQKWLSTHNMSPLTRRPMTMADIQPNFALRGAIERWKLANEAMPAPLDVPTIVDTKSISITAHEMNDKTVLDIKTTHDTPMESVSYRSSRYFRINGYKR